MASTQGAAGDNADLRRTYVLVLVIEAIVLLALYWLGRNYR